MSLNKTKLQKGILSRAGYTPVPNELLTVLAGEASAVVVWLYLFGQADEWQPSIRQICKGTGMENKRVLRALATLQERGMLIIHEGEARFMKNEYVLTDISQWKRAAVETTPSCVKTTLDPVCQNDSITRQEILQDNNGGSGEEEIFVEREEIATPETTTTTTPEEIMDTYLGQQQPSCLVQQIGREVHLREIAVAVKTAGHKKSSCQRLEKKVLTASKISKRNPDWKQWEATVRQEWASAVEAAYCDRVVLDTNDDDYFA